MKYRLAGAAAIVLFSTTAHAHDAPTKELGCMVFNSKGRHLHPNEMSEKEVMQVSNCIQEQKLDQAVRFFNFQPAGTGSYGVKPQ
jgi:hypothetical protein